MTIEIPEIDLAPLKLTSAEAKVDFAIGLYTGRHASMGKSAKIAGLSYSAFLQELGRRGICINYSMNDLTHDLQLMETVEGKRK